MEHNENTEYDVREETREKRPRKRFSLAKLGVKFLILGIIICAAAWGFGARGHSFNFFPGHRAFYHNVEHRYWSIDYETREGEIHEWRDEIREEIRESVREARQNRRNEMRRRWSPQD